MRDTWNAAKVGLLVMLVLAGSYAIFRLVDERTEDDDDYTVWAIFEDASGLIPKSRVLVAGIPVGSIQRIRLWGKRARIDIRIKKGVELHADAVATRKSASLLGEYVLAIDPGHRQEQVVEDGGQIRGDDGPPSTDEVIEDVGAVAESVRHVAEQIERTFGTDEGGRRMESALRNLTEALESANRIIQTNERVVDNTLQNVEDITEDSKPRIEDILRDVQASTEDVREILANHRPNIESGIDDASATADSLQRGAEELELVIDDIHDITDRTARGRGTVGRLTNDEHLIDEVEGVAEGIGDIVAGIDRLQTIVQLRSDYSFLSNTFKSYVELRLQPREDRYYYIQLINDPRGNTSVEQTTITRSPPSAGDPPIQRETRVTTRDTFRFSLALAKRLYFATFRFGIIESSGGIGVDLHFFDDNLEINTDLFQFGERANPRLRSNVAYQVVTRLWVLGGIDDVFNDSRDFYLGAALRFNDDDLKSILPFAGGLLAGGTR